MRLTWNKEYDDYTDARWLPYYQKVCSIVNDAKEGKYTQEETDIILDVLEQISEAMNYEAYMGDFGKLEPTMRIYMALLNVIKQRNASQQGFFYPEMVFARLNALLYKSKKMNRQAANEYKEFCSLAHQCSSLVSNSTTLTDEQKLFLYWACIDGLHESVQTHTDILDISKSLSDSDEIISITAYAKPLAAISDGISERLGDTIADIAGVYCRNNRLTDGIRCYDEAIDIYNTLYHKNNSDFHKARALWIKVSKQLLILSATGNLSALSEVEADATQLINKNGIHPGVYSIALGTLGLINMQKGAANQQSGALDAAVQLTEKSANQLENAMEIIEKEISNAAGHYKYILGQIAARLYSSLLSALDCLGVQCYHVQDHNKAMKAFTTALEKLTNSQKYFLDDESATLLRAEINQYMGIIHAENGDVNQAIFYVSQAADFSAGLAARSSNKNILNIAVLSNTLSAEYYLMLKDKSAALKYASKGIECVNKLSAIDPGNEILGLRASLEKYMKKASRKFF